MPVHLPTSVGHVFGLDFFFQHAVIFLQVLQPHFAFGQLPFQIAQRTKAQPRGFVQLVFAFGTIDLGLRRVDLFLDRLQRRDRALLQLPVRAQSVRLLFEIGHFFFDLRQAFLAGLSPSLSSTPRARFRVA